MTEEEIRQALEFDRAQGFSENEIKLIQRTVGAQADGQWRAATVEAVWQWQSDHGIPPDGKVWRSASGNTWPPLQQAAAAADEPSAQPARFQVGVWIDDPPSRVLSASFADGLKEMGVSSAAVMVNASNTRSGDPPWRVLWTADQLAQAAGLFKQRGVELILTAWPRPSQDQVEEVSKALKELLDAAGVSVLELDAEGNWNERFLDGFPSMQEAGRTLAGKLRDALPPGGRLELTTYPFHAEFSPSATLSPHMDVVLPQAYSVFKADDPSTHWGDQLGPGNMQRLAIGRARSISGVQVACGLAAYFQDRYPGHSAQQSMSRALQAVSAEGVSEIRYWSSKWAIGHRKNDYAGAFLSDIPKTRR